MHNQVRPFELVPAPEEEPIDDDLLMLAAIGKLFFARQRLLWKGPLMGIQYTDEVQPLVGEIRLIVKCLLEVASDMGPAGGMGDRSAARSTRCVNVVRLSTMPWAARR